MLTEEQMRTLDTEVKQRSMGIDPAVAPTEEADSFAFTPETTMPEQELPQQYVAPVEPVTEDELYTSDAYITGPAKIKPNPAALKVVEFTDKVADNIKKTNIYKRVTYNKEDVLREAKDINIETGIPVNAILHSSETLDNARNIYNYRRKQMELMMPGENEVSVDSLMKAYPGLDNIINSGSEIDAAIALQNIKNVRQMTGIVEVAKGNWNVGVLERKMGQAGVKAFREGRAVTEEEYAKYDAIQKQIQDFKETPGFFEDPMMSIVGGTARQIPQQLTGVGTGTLYGGVLATMAAGATALTAPLTGGVSMAAVPAAAKTGFSWGMRAGYAVDMFENSAGQRYIEYSRFKDENGKRVLTDEEARAYAAVAAAVETGIEFMNAGQILDVLKGNKSAAAKQIREVVAGATDNATFIAGLKRMLSGATAVAVTESLEEGAQEGADRILSTGVSLYKGSNAIPKYTPGQVFEGALENTLAALPASIGFGISAAGGGTIGIVQHAARLAEIGNTRYNEEMKNVTGVGMIKTMSENADVKEFFKKDPDVAQQVLKNTVAGTGYEKVNIDTEMVARQENGLAALRDIGERAGMSAEEVQTAVETGADLTVPTEVYFQMRAENENFVINDDYISFSNIAPSFARNKYFAEQYKAEFDAIMKDVDAKRMEQQMAAIDMIVQDNFAEGIERDAAAAVLTVRPDNPIEGLKELRGMYKERLDAMLNPVIRELEKGMKQGVEIVRIEGGKDGREDSYRRESQNADWAREFYRENKRWPTRFELEGMAIDILSGRDFSKLMDYQNVPEMQEWYDANAAQIEELLGNIEAFDNIEERIANLDADELQTMEGMSREAYDIYKRESANAIANAPNEAVKRAAKMGAALLARHADRYAEAKRAAGEKNYTAQDYLREKLGIKMGGEYEGGAGDTFFQVSADEFNRQKEDVVKQYKDTDLWMKAPNGNPTNLTEDQWVTVRTPAFKNWFGHWDLVAERAKLDKAVPVPVQENRVGATETEKPIANAIRQFNEMYPGGEVVPTVIGDVKINEESVSDSLSHKFSQAKLDAVLSLVEGMKTASYMGQMKDPTNKAKTNHYFVYKIKYGDGTRYVFVRGVQNFNNPAKLYVHEVYDEESIKKRSETISWPPDHEDQVQSRGIALYTSILNAFLNNVNSSKVVDENGEPKPLYHGTKMAEFNEFNKGNIFMTDDKVVADWYAGTENVADKRTLTLDTKITKKPIDAVIKFISDSGKGNFVKLKDSDLLESVRYKYRYDFEKKYVDQAAEKIKEEMGRTDLTAAEKEILDIAEKNVKLLQKFVKGKGTAKDVKTSVGYTKQAYDVRDKVEDIVEAMELSRYIRSVGMNQLPSVLYKEGDRWVNADARWVQYTEEELRNRAREILRNRAEGGVYPLFANIRNPLVMDAGGAGWRGLPLSKISGNPDHASVPTDTVGNYAKENGYDGAIIQHVNDMSIVDYHPADDIIAFDSTQVKDASGHNVGFDPQSGNIYLQRQAGNGSVRGATEFMEDGKRILKVFESGNESTIAHEMGHIFLADLKDMAAMENAPAQIVKDWETVKDWLGWRPDQAELTTAQHEKFAQGFEAYLMSGEAPVHGLKKIFRQFKRWLTKLYKDFLFLGGKPSMEVAQVMGRMLATEEEVEAAFLLRGSEFFDKTGATSQLDATSLAMYQRWKNEATQYAKEKVLKEAMKNLTKQRAKELEVVRKQMTDDIRTQLSSKPLYRAELVLSANPKLAEDWPAEQFGMTYEEYTEAIKAQGTLDEATKKAVDVAMQEVEEGLPLEEIKRDAENAVNTSEYRGMYLSFEQDFIQKKLRRDESLSRQIEQTLADIEREASGIGEEIAEDSAEVKRLKQRIKELRYQARWTEAELKTLNRLERANNKAERMAAIKAVKEMLRNARKNVRVYRDNAVTNYKYIKQYAKDNMAEMSVDDATNVAKWTALEKRAGRESVEALKRALDSELRDTKVNDESVTDAWKKANDAKLRQRVFAEYAALATKNQAKVQRKNAQLQKRQKTIEKNNNIPANERYMYVHGLYVLGLSKVDAQMPQGAPSIMAMFKEYQDNLQAFFVDEDGNISLPDYILSALSGNTVYNDGYTNLTMDQYGDFVDVLTVIYKAGIDANKVKSMKDINGNTVLISDVAENIVAEMNERIPAIVRNDITNAGSLTFAESIQDKARRARISLTKPETILEWMGPTAHRYIYETVNQSWNKERAMLEQTAVTVKAIWEPYNNTEKSEMRSKRQFRFGTSILTREEMICVAFNWGTEINRRRIMDGFNVDESTVRELLSNLTQKDWQMVTSVWELVNSYWPETVKVEESMVGVAPEKQSAMPFEIVGKDGNVYKLNGGYYPIKYDPNKSLTAANQAQDDMAKQYAAGNAAMNRNRGYLKQRTQQKVSRPVPLSFDVLNKHLNDVIHNICFRESLRDVNRIIKNQAVSQAIQDHFGIAQARMFEQWVRDCWAPDIQKKDPVSSAMEFFRHKQTAAVLGYRMSTALLNSLNIFPITDYLGAARTVDAIQKFYSDPRSNWDFALNRSIFLRERAETMDRDAGEVLRKEFIGGYGTVADTLIRGEKAIEAHAFDLLAVTDLALACPLWLSEYQRVYQENSKNIAVMDEDAIIRLEMEAVAAGDKAVRQIFGSGEMKDLAPVQKGTEMTKALTMYYSYFNVVFNALYGGYAKGRMQAMTEGATTVLGQSLGIRIAPLVQKFAYWAVFTGVAEGILRNAIEVASGGSDDPEEWLKKIAKGVTDNVFGTIPVVRDMASMIFDKLMGEKYFSARPLPAYGLLDTGMKLWNTIESKKKTKIDVFRESMRITNGFTGIGNTLTDAMATTAYWVDTDFDKPFLEYLSAIIFDKRIDKKKRKK